VLEVIAAFQEASGRAIPHDVVARRAGDAAETVADPSLAAELLGWRTTRGLAEMCRDGWAWQQANPNGYAS
jgi:UDP-glucose 4-epimerase